MDSKSYKASAGKRDPNLILRPLAVKQFGLISRRQAVQAGMKAGTITSRLRTGAWRWELPSVYAMAGTSTQWPQPVMAAQLWAGPDMVASHRAAAALWKLDGIEPGTVELITTAKLSRVPEGIALHRTTVLAPRDHGELGRFRLTSLPRTLIDLAAVAEPEVVEAAMESAFRKDETVLGQLTERVEELGRKGRRGIVVVREILRARDPGAAPTESMFETRFLRFCRRYGFPEPVRQYEVWVEGVFIVRLDFAYPRIPIGFQTDGYWCHMGRKRWYKEVGQGNELVALGWPILHITWDDLTKRPEWVADLMRRALATYS
jgi:hypothetical protein